MLQEYSEMKQELFSDIDKVKNLRNEYEYLIDKVKKNKEEYEKQMEAMLHMS